MPTSRYDLIPTVLDLVTRIKPRSILDVGIGFGKYGVLFREYLDLWKPDQLYNWRERAEKDRTLIYGVEAFKSYNNPVWFVYDKIYENNIFDIYEGIPEVDLLFLGDVIEHFTKEDGLKLLRNCKWKEAIIITPIQVLQQEAVYGNKFEQHVSSWTIDDLKEFNPQIHATVDNQQLFQLKKEL